MWCLAHGLDEQNSLTIVDFFAVFHARKGGDAEKRLATEWFALLYHHPNYEYQHKLLNQTNLDSLRTELGPEMYEAAWERGKSLDLETVVRNILDEYYGVELPVSQETS